MTLTFVFLSIHEGDTSRQYVPELRKIEAETPMFPGSQKIADKVSLKQSRASLFTSYATQAAFDEIELFLQTGITGARVGSSKGTFASFY